MKKTLLFVLTIVLALISAPVFAEVTISGELDYSAMINGDETAGEFDKIELDFAADIDENNSVAIELEDDIKSNDIGNSSADINYATATTDWAGILDLPFTMATTIGYDAFYAGDDNYITGWEYEGTGGVYMDKEGAAKVSLGFMDGMINPMVAYNFDANDKTDSNGKAIDDPEYLLGLNINFAPVVANAYYLSSAVDYDKYRPDGEFGVDAMATIALDEDGMVLQVSGAFDKNLDSDAAAGDEYAYGFGAAFYVSDFMVGTSMKGNDDQAAEYLGMEVKYFMSEMLTFAVAPNFYLGDDDDMDTFLGLVFLADVAVSDSFSYRLGYLYSDGNGASCSYSPAYETAADDGGVFVGCNVNF